MLGSIWIEGVWIQETYDDINGSSSLIGRGVAQFMYIGSELHLKTGVYHYKEPQLGKETWSQSNHAYVRESDLLYINHFTVGSGDTETTGIATGHFLLDSNSKYPTTYQGRMIYFDGKKAKRQITRRINPKLVKDAIKKGGDNWKNVLLQDNNQ